MTRFILALLYMGVTTSAFAVPTDELLNKITKHIVKVHVALANGSYGSGSGVVIAKDKIVTNCHVVANAVGISVGAGGESYTATAITPDWYHDVCLVKVEGIKAPIATIGSSKNLQYEQPVFAIGYPNFSPAPSSTFGYVKGLFPMDDSVIIRASSTFRLGSSGGGVFDDAGNLVGVITLKSPGKHAYYYNMPVEWVQALLTKPEQSIVTEAKPAFWAGPSDKWPFFMQVVHPYLTESWTALFSLASKWTAQEPNNTEAWFYLAAAEYAIHDTTNAEAHLRKVAAMNAQHSQAIYYLALIAEESGKHMEALTNVALLTTLDSDAATKLRLKMDNKY
jgi:serine protease Do